MVSSLQAQSRICARQTGITIGVIQPGQHNAITDVQGATAGHTTIIVADSIQTGVFIFYRIVFFGNGRIFYRIALFGPVAFALCRKQGIMPYMV